MANDLLRQVTGRARSACGAQGIIASTAADHAQWRPDTAPQADATLPAVEGAEEGGASDGTQPCRLEMAMDGVKVHIDGRRQAPKVATLLVRRLPVQPEEPTRGPLVARRYLGLLGSEPLVTRIKPLSRDAGWAQIPVAEIRGDGTPWMWQIALVKAPLTLMATMRLIGRTILSLIMLTGLSPWAVPASTAEAATYYVGTSGKDEHPGTEARPLKTLQQAADKVRPGDTVIVRGGRYAGLSKSNFHGAPGAPITFKAAPGERVTLDAFLSSHRCGIIALGGVASYLVFDGFELVNTNPVLARMRQLDLNNPDEFAEYVSLYPPFRCNHGVRMESSPSNSHHLTFQNMEVHHSGIAFSGGINFGQFLNNHVHDMSYGWYVAGDQNVWRGNNIHHGIFGFHLRTGLTNSLIENNLIHHHGMISHVDFTDKPPRLQHDGTGIWIRGRSDNNTIRNNLIFNNGPRGGYGGISLVGSGDKIYNNTLYGNNIGINRYNSDVAIRNNIIYGNGKAIVPPLPDANQHNNLTTDPKFVNADGADFRLQPSSPAINAGAALAEVPCDIGGNRRPAGSAYDIGAYEYGSTPSGACIGGRR